MMHMSLPRLTQDAYFCELSIGEAFYYPNYPVLHYKISAHQARCWLNKQFVTVLVPQTRYVWRVIEQ